jgi:hypothetical protein
VILKVGMYSFGSKRVAFRNDYCLRCRAAQLAVQIRSFYAIHVYWVPLLPVGFFKVWRCVKCDTNPHATVHTRRVFKAGLVLIVALGALPFWFLPAEGSDWGMVWAIRGASVVALAASLWWATTGHQADPSLRDALAGVRPYDARTCPFCSGYLYDQPYLHCPACALRCA